MKRRYLIPVCIFLLFTFFLPVHAETVDISEVPQRLADALGVSLFAGQTLISALVMALFLLPTLLVTRGKNLIGVVFIGVAIMGFLLALGWLPLWFATIMILLVVALWGRKILGWIS